MTYWENSVSIGFSEIIPLDAEEISKEQYDARLDEIRAEAIRQQEEYEEWLKEHPEEGENG